MTEKWQEVIKHWEEWGKSLRETRNRIEKDYGNIANLSPQVRTESKENNDGSTNKYLKIRLNDDAIVWWRIDDEITETANKFVTERIGLSEEYILFYSFVDWWKASAFPKFAKGSNINGDTEMEDSGKSIQLESKVVKIDNKYRIRNSISWYSGQVKFEELAHYLCKIKWPFKDDEVLNTGKGGRPEKSKNDIIYPEAIVCYLLNKKQRLKQAAIANLFDWKTHYDSYGNIMSNTVRQRVEIGKRILAGDIEQNNTNK